VVVLGLVIVGALTAVTFWRPWDTPDASPSKNVPMVDAKDNAFTPEPIDPVALLDGLKLDRTKIVTLVYVNTSGGPCKVTVAGGQGSNRRSISANLPAAESRQAMVVPGPYTIKTVTVERDGKARQQEMNVTIAGGQTHEVRVNADDTVEVVAISK
jgi:hypothetical protein